MNIKTDILKEPWTGEPDRVYFSVKGLPCLLIRHDQCGHLCGFVGIPEGHIFYNMPKDEIKEQCEVYGGLSFHSPIELPNIEGEWARQSDFLDTVFPSISGKMLRWVSFYCAEDGDYYPKLTNYGSDPGNYKTVQFAMTELMGLANQIAFLDI